MTSSAPCSLRVHPGRGPFHFICVPGLVPDGPECFARQVRLLRRYGTVSILSYPDADFPLEAVLAQIDALVRTLAAAGRRPVLMGVSVGGGLCLEVLRRARDAGSPLPVAGSVLVSPLTGTGDLAPLLKRLLAPIEAACDRGEDPAGHLERGRAFFKSLAARALEVADGGAPQPAWRTLLALLTPSGLAALRDRVLRARIEATLDRIPAAGAVARVVSLRLLGGLGQSGAISPAPTLLLWGAKERHTLDMEGPGTAVLCRPDLAWRWFPAIEVQWVYGDDGDPAPHASLLRHGPAFNAHLRRWCERLRRTAAPAGMLRWAR